MEEKIIEKLIELCDEDEIKNNLDIELVKSDLLDSLSYAELLFFIEDEFDIIISPSEISRTEIDTPRKIIDVLKSKAN